MLSLEKSIHKISRDLSHVPGHEPQMSTYAVSGLFCGDTGNTPSFASLTEGVRKRNCFVHVQALGNTAFVVIERADQRSMEGVARGGAKIPGSPDFLRGLGAVIEDENSVLFAGLPDEDTELLDIDSTDKFMVMVGLLGALKKINSDISASE